jgi:hypothetical protein
MDEESLIWLKENSNYHPEVPGRPLARTPSLDENNEMDTQIPKNIYFAYFTILAGHSNRIAIHAGRGPERWP